MNSGRLEKIASSLNSSVRRGVGTLLMASAALACGGDGTGPDPPPPEVHAVISGPDVVALDCSLQGSATYTANQSKGTINRFSWNIDGMDVLTGTNRAETETLNHTFTQYKTHSLKLSALDFSNGVLDTDTKTVSTQLPSDVVGCLSSSYVSGKEALLLRPGMPSVASSYSLNAPDAFKSQITQYVWSLRREDGAPKVIASGAGVSSANVEFTQEGSYTLSVEQFISQQSKVVSQEVFVKEGEPLLEAGKIALIRAESPKLPGLYYMDGETGFVSGPAMEDVRLGADVFCTSDRIVIPLPESNGLGQAHSNMFTMNHDGSDLTRIIEVAGNVWQPSAHASGKIVVVDDSRSNYVLDELAIYDPGASQQYRYLSGASTNFEYVGLHPDWSPSGNKIALGNVTLSAYPNEDRIVIYNSSGTGLYPLHDRPLKEVYGVEAYGEGTNGLSWDPRNEYLAYTVRIGDDVNMLAISSLDGSYVKLLAPALGGPVRYTPSGSHILFSQLNPEKESLDVVAIPREGGNVVNLTRAWGENLKVMDSIGGYCHK